MKPKSVHSDEIRRFAAGQPDDQADKPATPTLTLIIAVGIVVMIVVLALRVVSTPTALTTASAPAAVPTAYLVTAEPTAASVPSAVPVPTAAPQADGQPLPATMPAGVSPGDQTLTIYQGWPWRDTSQRAGEWCLLEVWPDGNTTDQVWIMCVLLGLEVQP